MNKHIFWIASYPKSGNTLLRSILSALFFSSDGNFNFELLKKIVTLEEVARLRTVKQLTPDKFANKNIKEQSGLIFDNLSELKKKSNLGFNEDFAFFKTHFCTHDFNNKKFLIEEYVRGIIYIVRDPRDVCVSWAKYANISMEKSLNFLIDEEAFVQWTGAPGAPEYKENIPVFVSSWQKHVESWISYLSKFPSLIIRYEDLVYSKEKVINTILEFFEKNYNIVLDNKNFKIKNVIKTTEFSRMKEEEKTKGFEESNISNFFNVGKKEQWRKKLDKNYVKILNNEFKNTMNKFKYN